MGKGLHFEVGNCAGISARIFEQDGAYRVPPLASRRTRDHHRRGARPRFL